jgi:hypothetical protein
LEIEILRAGLEGCKRVGVVPQQVGVLFEGDADFQTPIPILQLPIFLLGLAV